MADIHSKVPITVAKGDGIGPEIMGAVLQILEASGASLEIHPIEIGEKVYLKGESTGIEPQTWETLRNTSAFLKAPITTPQGGGFKSLNVTIRTTLGLFANVRPCVAYHPFIQTKHPNMNVVVVRENEEDLYAGIEYRQSEDTTHALKLISKSGSERIIRYAFEYAVANERKKVTCFTKDNILKITDGLFHERFEEIGKEYPSIEKEHWIVDIGAAKLADTPSAFDVVVMPNLYGDILSDVAAQIAGSVGLAGSANIGLHGTMFEAIHGSAPRRAGQNLANPSGLLLAAIQMLVHIGLSKPAALIHNAWLKTIEEGIHTYDIFKEGTSREKVGTKEFGKSIIDRLGKTPETLPPVHYNDHSPVLHKEQPHSSSSSKALVGVDIFIDSTKSADTLQKQLHNISSEPLKLTMIANRGVIVWPTSMPETHCVDQWRCRFEGKNVTAQHITNLLSKLSEQNLEFTQVQNLYTFDNKPGYSVSQLSQ